jgi:7-carboxy-7-deazaguanine synthase
MDLSTKLNINEIFYSIQGEGTRAGLPCIFIRLQGCPLRCTWCDTPYALELKKIEKMMSFAEIIDEIRKFNCHFVEFTGGEPLSQKDSATLMKILVIQGYDVAIETSGHLDVSVLDSRISKIMDLKLPGSGMYKFNNYDNIEHLTDNDEVKFVVADKEDFFVALEIIKTYELIFKVKTVLFSPVFNSITPLELAELVKEYAPECRMQLQMHKFIWEPNERGV